MPAEIRAQVLRIRSSCAICAVQPLQYLSKTVDFEMTIQFLSFEQEEDCVVLEVFTEVVVNCAIPRCSTYLYRRFDETYHLHLQGRKSAEQDTSL
jgi:hypothetical protein